MFCGWVCLPCSLHTKQSCQAANVSEMQINTKQWNKWIPMGIKVQSCASDVKPVFGKHRPIPYNCDSKKKTQITILVLTLVSYGHQGAALICIPCALTLMPLFNISISRHSADRLGCTNNLFCEITHQMAHSNLGLAVVFALYLVVAGHKRKVSFFFFFFLLDVHMLIEQVFPAFPPHWIDCHNKTKIHKWKQFAINLHIYVAILNWLRHLSWPWVGSLKGNLATWVITSLEAWICQQNQYWKICNNFHDSRWQAVAASERNETVLAKHANTEWRSERKMLLSVFFSELQFKSYPGCQIHLWPKSRFSIIPTICFQFGNCLADAFFHVQL